MTMKWGCVTTQRRSRDDSSWKPVAKEKKGDWEKPTADLSFLLTLPELQASMSTQATAFRGDRKHRAQTWIPKQFWEVSDASTPRFFLYHFPYVLEDWKHPSQLKPSGFLPVRGGSSPRGACCGPSWLTICLEALSGFPPRKLFLLASCTCYC